MDVLAGSFQTWLSKVSVKCNSYEFVVLGSDTFKGRLLQWQMTWFEKALPMSVLYLPALTDWMAFIIFW